MQPLTYVIAVTDSRDSSYKIAEQNLAKTLGELSKWSWPYAVWSATTPQGVNWPALGVELLPRGAILKRPGAQACFHSHFGLWQHCVSLGKPIVVMEHDARVTAAWPQNIDLDQSVWKLHRPDGRGDRVNDYTGLWSCGAWAYTLTPLWAQQLITFSVTVGAQAVDKQLGDRVVPWQYWTTDLVRHGPVIGRSTTSPKINK
jgi:hypothetical protein